MGHALCYVLRKSWIREKKNAVLKRPSHSSGGQTGGQQTKIFPHGETFHDVADGGLEFPFLE